MSCYWCQAVVLLVQSIEGLTCCTFCLQGNAPEELPEQIIGCGCIYRADLPAARAFQASALHSVSLNAGASLAATAATTPEPTAVVA